MVYTIGYSTFLIQDFIYVIKKFNIHCIIDVRSNPLSKYFTDYNQHTLAITLKNNNILYRHYAKEFGARQSNSIFLTSEGFVDFNKFILSEQFLSGIKKVKAGLELGYNFCILCAEADPLTCHRSIMVSRGFLHHNIEVNHILKTQILEPHTKLEKRLVNLYFDNNHQISLFEGELSYYEMLTKSYDLKNKEIGFYAKEVC